MMMNQTVSPSEGNPCRTLVSSPLPTSASPIQAAHPPFSSFCQRPLTGAGPPYSATTVAAKPPWLCSCADTYRRPRDESVPETQHLDLRTLFPVYRRTTAQPGRFHQRLVTATRCHQTDPGHSRRLDLPVSDPLRRRRRSVYNSSVPSAENLTR